LQAPFAGGVRKGGLTFRCGTSGRRSPAGGRESGGGGGNRTRVRPFSAFGPTCL